MYSKILINLSESFYNSYFRNPPFIFYFNTCTGLFFNRCPFAKSILFNTFLPGICNFLISTYCLPRSDVQSESSNAAHFNMIRFVSLHQIIDPTAKSSRFCFHSNVSGGPIYINLSSTILVVGVFFLIIFQSTHTPTDSDKARHRLYSSRLVGASFKFNEPHFSRFDILLL